MRRNQQHLNVSVGNLQVESRFREVGGLEPTDTFKKEASGHHGLTSHKAGLAVARTHALEEGSVRSSVGLHGVDHAVTGVTSNLAEVRVLTKVHHRGRIHDAAVVTISEGRDVALTHVLDDFQKVSGHVKLGRFTSCVVDALGFATRQVITTLVFASNTIGFGLQQFVCEDAVTPAAIVVQQGQRTDGLVEDIEVTGVKQQALSGNQGFASNLESRRLGAVTSIGGDRCIRAGSPRPCL